MLFEGVRIFTLNFGAFKKGAAMMIPGIGIFIGPQDAGNLDLLRHEFGEPGDWLHERYPTMQENLT